MDLSARKESRPDKNAHFDGKLERSRRVGKIPLSSFRTERPLCQEAGLSINSRVQITIMVTIWRGRASVRATTWESSGPVSISASRVEIGPVQVLGGSNSGRANRAKCMGAAALANISIVFIDGRALRAKR